MRTYYAVCNVNVPISVELDAESLDEALTAWNELDARASIDNASTDAEDALEIDGEGMSDEEFEAALEAAGARHVRPLGEIDQQGRSIVGDWNLWVHDDETPRDVTIEASASNPRPSETDNGMDVDVEVTIDDGGPNVAPRRVTGEVTLINGRKWGDSPAAWVSGGVLQELYQLSDGDFRRALHVLESAASEAAADYDPPTAEDLGVPNTRAVAEALEDAGHSVSEYSGGGLYVSVEDGTQGDGSEVDGTPELEEIRSIVAPFGMGAEWSGDSNTDSDGDTTSDVVIR